MVMWRLQKDDCTLGSIGCKEPKQYLAFAFLVLICFFVTLPLFGKLKLNTGFGSTNVSNVEPMLSGSGENVGSGKSGPSKKTGNSVNKNGRRNTTNPYQQNTTDGTLFIRKETKPENTEKLPFLKTYRNPCWRELSDGNITRIRCLPYFYLVGAPKCGTTDLYERLTKHPLISKKVNKENHWLTRIRFNSAAKTGTLSSYLRYYNNAVEKDITKVENNSYHPMIFGDGSASTLWDNRKLLKYHINDTAMTVPPFTNADIIYRLNPNAKILIILRNPITRLYSEYFYFDEYRNVEGVDDFHNLVVSTIHQYNDCMNKYSLRYCAYFTEAKFKPRLQIGFYHIYIEDYFRVFPREQVKIIKAEEYSQHIPETVTDTYSFLGVGKPSDKTLARVRRRRRANERKKAYKKIGRMLPKTWKMLADFYRPFNEKLVELLGDEFRYN